MRWRLYRIIGLSFKKSFIAPGLFVGGSGLVVNEGVILNYNCFIDATGEVKLGSNVAIGPGSTILTVTHHIGPAAKRRGLEQLVLPVKIGDGCWIGANATILPGVKIGESSVIAAGSVVTSDCKANSVYGGVPAKFLKSIES
ncbi:DapH/DapD/GlmU-related protein [Rhodococcoides kyotonense]|uniref:DapH/DapD/GlmU-related protein n=1 Tax=Rhodococcoides kyotonense TaxID=398843 RepID=UPI001595C5B1